MKKIISVTLCLIMLVSSFGLGNFSVNYISANAEEISTTDDNLVFSGTVGTKLTWNIDKDTKTLSIVNDGAMVSFSADEAPWIQASKYIENVDINDGCTNISNYAFRNCTYLKYIDIPDTVQDISSTAFSGCTGLLEITIPEGITEIKEETFYGCIIYAAKKLS